MMPLSRPTLSASTGLSLDRGFSRRLHQGAPGGPQRHLEAPSMPRHHELHRLLPQEPRSWTIHLQAQKGGEPVVGPLSLPLPIFSVAPFLLNSFVLPLLKKILFENDSKSNEF